MDNIKLFLFCLVAPFLATIFMMLIVLALEQTGIARASTGIKLVLVAVLLTGWSYVSYDVWRRYKI